MSSSVKVSMFFDLTEAETLLENTDQQTHLQ